MNDNGAVAGGPGSVHEFDGTGAHSKYMHGICGNAAGVPQVYNKVGEVQDTYVAGDVVDFKVVITAHHVGYFEFELCEDASSLSEACFMKHRLLKEGCECECPGDSTLSCPECESCRRWWKPLLEGELSQTVTAGYGGTTLPGKGNLVPYEYTMRYVIPAGLKTSRGVLRWHYMTTNSCTSKTSSPEEFWNCADIAVSDAGGDVGAAISFDDAALESLPVTNLIPAITSGELTGVGAVCPEDSAGKPLGVGASEEYEGLCGAGSGETYENCVDLSSGAGGGAVDCSAVPESGILCESECSGAWFQCHDRVAYTKYVAPGTKCKGNKFVLEAECANYEPEAEPEPEEEPEPAATEAQTQAPTEAPVATTSEAATATTAATEASTKAPTAAPNPPAPACGDCSGCMWGSGVCYTDVGAAYCGWWPDNVWCGGQGLAQSSARRVRRHEQFLGPALVQASVVVGRSVGAGDTTEEL